MDARRAATLLIEVVVFGSVLAVMLSTALGYPVLLGYVETGSMEPTLDPGDGFVAVPTAIAGPVEPGDVVVYDAEVIEHGGLVTHRVVAATDRGFLTQGDANPYPDQDSGEPPVPSDRIYATALQVNGHVVVVPGLGTVVESLQHTVVSLQARVTAATGGAVAGLQGLGVVIFAITAVWYAVAAYLDRRGRDRDRRPRRGRGVNPRTVVAVLTLLLVVASTLAMTVPAGPEEYTVVSAEMDSPGTRVVPAGESETMTVEVRNGGWLPVVAFVEPTSDGVAVSPQTGRVAPQSHLNVSVTFSVPPETGSYRRSLSHHRYLAVLPTGLLRSLYGVSSWLPVLAVDLFLGAAFYAVGSLIAGRGRLRFRRRDRSRVAGALRRWR